MLIAIMPDEIHKLSDFVLYSQNPNTLLCCGITNDTESKAVYTEISEIPAGQEQRCLPQSYGTHLSIERIERGLEDYMQYEVLLAAAEAAYEEGVNTAYD